VRFDPMFVRSIYWLLLGFGGACAVRSADLEVARLQFREFHLGGAAVPVGNLTLKDTNEAVPVVAQAVEFARRLGEDGSWRDIDYASQARSGWPPSIHYTRILAMVAAAQANGESAAERARLLAAVHRAFAFWIARDFVCPNWWYNQIGAPKLFATIGLLLGDELAPAERAYLTTVMLPRAKIAMTGQNRVWLAGNTLMLGLLSGNEAMVNDAATTIWHEVAVTTGEGIQPDFSFHQHGPQQQFGNYGMALAVEICRWGTILRGTRWAMPAEKLAAYRGFLLDGEAWTLWRGRMDISACGRQLMPRQTPQKAETITQVMQNVAVFDPPEADRYRRIVTNERGGGVNDFVGERVFWRSDYVVHRRSDFCATLKLCSKRVVGAESLNSENLLGYHLADGALYVYARGDEYDDIFPVWDWRKIPGVTCAQGDGEPPRFREVRGANDFVGGVTDGRAGVAALDFARDGVAAKKAWFFTDNGVVCLGHAITAPAGTTVATTINQVRLRGPVTAKRASQPVATLATGEETLAGVEWIEHDGWRYSFLEPAAVHVRIGPRTGNWHRVFDNPETPRADVTENLFTLWIDHGVGPTGGSYAYAVTRAGEPGLTQVVVNSPERQVVRLAPDQSGLVFWTAGAAAIGGSGEAAADSPCVVLTCGSGAVVADPTQRITALGLTIDGVRRDVALPQGGDAGRSVAVKTR
jgi:chondroitin AC lyase